jgi:replicative DNA helicase Mcm
MSDSDEELQTAILILRNKCPDYIKVIQHFPEYSSICINYKDIQAAGPVGIKLADKLIVDPKYTFSTLETALFELAKVSHDEATANKMLKDVRFRFINLPSKRRIRMIRANDVNRFLSFEGICRMVSAVKPKITVAVFRCKHCGNTIRSPQRGKTLEMPQNVECANCNSQQWQHEVALDTFANVQFVNIQEFQEGLKAAEQPHSIKVEVSDDLCGVVNAGYRTTINGFLKVNEKGKSLVVDTYVDANMIELGDQSFTDVQIGESDVERIKEMAKLPNIHEVLAASVAPAIYGHDLVKTALVLQLFGGVTRTEKASRIRGDIHTLLLGDPGIAKSILLDFMSMVSPRGVKASGGQSSSVGLTCAAKQDANGEWTLEGGALVLADGGLCCIDEFDKMEKEDRAAIHGAMEQQKIDVNKAGINATLLTRCSILAAANPKAGRWDMFKSLTDQVPDLPPSLLSRFDLIFIMRDVPNLEKDTHIADHILEGSSDDDSNDGVSVEFLRKYIAYAKREVNPKRSKGANSIIKEFYLKLRGLGRDGSVPITPRKLEDLKRLAEASARVRLSPVAEEIDAKIAVQLVDACLRDVAYDAKSGRFDIDRVICNTSSAQRSHIALIKDALEMQEHHRMPRVDLYNKCIEHLNKQEVDMAIEKMQLNAMVAVSKDDEVTLV